MDTQGAPVGLAVSENAVGGRATPATSLEKQMA